MDYGSHFLQRNRSDSSAKWVGLNLAQLCVDCSIQLPSLAATTLAADSVSNAGLGGACLDPSAPALGGLSLCLSPSFGDALGGLISGDNATFRILTGKYAPHVRKQSFQLACAMQPVEEIYMPDEFQCVQPEERWIQRELHRTAHGLYSLPSGSDRRSNLRSSLVRCETHLYSCSAPAFFRLRFWIRYLLLARTRKYPRCIRVGSVPGGESEDTERDESQIRYRSKGSERQCVALLLTGERWHCTHMCLHLIPHWSSTVPLVCELLQTIRGPVVSLLLLPSTSPLAR